MAKPSISDLKMWVGNLFTKDDWDYNFSKITSWLSDGNGDLVVNSIQATNGLDMDGSQITNLAPATTGSQAVTLDQAETILNRTSYYYPFSIASGKIDASGNSAFLEKNSDTQVTVLAGNVNPDLVVIQSDATVESITSNVVLTVGTADGTYNIIKEKGQSPVITTGSVTVGKVFPTSQSAGDYFLDNSIVPFVGYKYDAVEGWVNTPFCHLGFVTVASGVATVTGFSYNDNLFDVNKQSLNLVIPDYKRGISMSTSFTAPNNGIYCCTVGNNNGSASFYVNGVQAYYYADGDGVNGMVNSPFTIILAKGDSCYWTSLSGQKFGKFFPLKGDN